MVQRFDYLVIGSGIAGMSFALKVANEGKSVALICKAGQEEANTYFAQGGIASVTNLKVDNFEKHIEDTMIAGDWISDRAAVEKVVREAPAQIEALRSLLREGWIWRKSFCKPFWIEDAVIRSPRISSFWRGVRAIGMENHSRK